MELKLNYNETPEIDLQQLMRAIISICYHHKTPCNMDVTVKLDDYPNPVRMVLCEGNQVNSENANCAIFDVSQRSELLNALSDSVEKEFETYAYLPDLIEHIKAFNCG